MSDTQEKKEKQTKKSARTTLGLSGKKKKVGATLELSELEQKCGEYLDGWQRTQADFQNYKKQTEKSMGEFRKFAQADLLQQLFPVVDYFKHAFEQVPEDQRDSSWMQGMNHIQTLFNKILEENGVQEMQTIGEKFDPELHECVKEEKSDKKPGTIIKQTQAGFKLNNKVVRPAKVIISKK